MVYFLVYTVGFPPHFLYKTKYGLFAIGIEYVWIQSDMITQEWQLKEVQALMKMQQVEQS